MVWSILANHFWSIHFSNPFLRCVVVVGVVVVGVVVVGGMDPPLDHLRPTAPCTRPPKDSFFFSPLPPPFSFFFSLSLWVFSLNFGGVFEAPGPSNVHVWSSFVDILRENPALEQSVVNF